MDKKTEDLLFKSALIIGAYFVVVKPVLKAIGVNPADQNTVNSQIALAPEQNAFSKDYQFGYIAYQGWSFPNDFSNEFTRFKAGYGMVEAGYDQIAEGIRNAFVISIWNLTQFSADINTIQTLFSQLPEQAAVSYIDAYLTANYNQGLMPLLKNGWGTILGINTLNNGLNDAQIAGLINQVSKLPTTLNEKNAVSPPSQVGSNGSTAPAQTHWYDFLPH